MAQANEWNNNVELQRLDQRLSRIETLLESLSMPAVEKYFYSTGEAADRLGFSRWYVRRLCATGHILAEKHPVTGRYLIAADEVQRIEARRDALDGE